MMRDDGNKAAAVCRGDLTIDVPIERFYTVRGQMMMFIHQ